MLFRKFTAIVSLAALSLFGSCTSRYQDLLRERDQEIRELNGRVASLRSEKEDLERQLTTERAAPKDSGAAAKDTADKGAAEASSSRQHELQNELGSEASVDYRNGKLHIGVEDTVTFSSGSHQLKDSAHKILTKIAGVLKRDFGNCKIFVEGHTDTDPIVKTKDKYDDNRDLSAKRANAVARFLIDQGVPESRIIIVGYGQFDPKDAKSKERNRRVEIVPVRN
jgi:flagellar motor protein MotB